MFKTQVRATISAVNTLEDDLLEILTGKNHHSFVCAVFLLLFFFGGGGGGG